MIIIKKLAGVLLILILMVMIVTVAILCQQGRCELCEFFRWPAGTINASTPVYQMAGLLTVLAIKTLSMIAMLIVWLWGVVNLLTSGEYLDVE